MPEITLTCQGRHQTYASREAAEADGVLVWAVRVVMGEDGRIHAFALESDYRAFKLLSPTNYR